MPHALIQDVKMPSENERALNVEIPETMHDIVSDTIKLNMIGAERDGTFIFFRAASISAAARKLIERVSLRNVMSSSCRS